MKNATVDRYILMKVFDTVQEGIMIANSSGTIEYVNPAFTSVTGYTWEEAIGKKPNLLKSGRQDESFYSNMWNSLAEFNQWEGQIWNKRKNGDIYPEWLKIISIKNQSDEIINYVAVFMDITERNRFEERIKKHAKYDVLTGLPNRMLFHERLEKELEYAADSGEMVAVLFFDLDRFKGINDSFGHAAADQLLLEFVERLKRCVSNNMIARMGGDEFTLLLTHVTGISDVKKVVKNILENCKSPLTIQGNEVFITVSGGISLFPYDGEDIETLIKNADSAMYRAKDLGGNHFQFYTRDMNEKAFEILKLETDLRKALDRNEFELYYQPKIDLQTARITGMEALLRWRHAELGMVSPAQFIPLAEETGLIIPIGEWVLRTACQQLKRWHDAGFPPFSVAVNLSMRQFEQHNLVAKVKQVLQETGLDPQFLELEVTESITMSNVDAVIAKLYELKALGICISIDDFGTGYSSLSYLKRLPIDKLKIDRAFIRDITLTPDDAAIITAMITLAHSLKLKVIAEGVETQEQKMFLRKQRCNEIQGFLISPPLSVDEFDGFQREYNKHSCIV